MASILILMICLKQKRHAASFDYSDFTYRCTLAVMPVSSIF